MLDLIFDRIPKILLGVFLLAGVTINFSNVVGRYVFQTAIFWAEEVLIFIIVWSVFVGLIAIAYNGAHLKMDLVSSKLGPGGRKLINALGIVLVLSCGVFVVMQSYQVVSLMGRNGQLSVTAEIPMTVPHSAILIGFILMIAAVIFRIRAYFSGDFD